MASPPPVDPPPNLTNDSQSSLVRIGDPMTDESRITRLANISTAISAPIAVLMLFMGYWQLRQIKVQISTAKEDINLTQEWNRRRFAAELIKTWNSDLKENVRNIRTRYLSQFHNGRKIPDSEIKKMFTFNEIGDEAEAVIYKGLYEEIIWMLNYMEFIAQCYRNNIVEKKLVDESQKDFMRRSYRTLEPFIIYYRDHTKAKEPWKPYSDLIIEWDETTPDPTLPPIKIDIE